METPRRAQGVRTSIVHRYGSVERPGHCSKRISMADFGPESKELNLCGCSKAKSLVGPFSWAGVAEFDLYLGGALLQLHHGILAMPDAAGWDNSTQRNYLPTELRASVQFPLLRLCSVKPHLSTWF